MSTAEALGFYTVAMPARFAEPAPTHATFVRRRCMAVGALLALVVTLGLAAGPGLADRGGAPASVSAVGRSTYVVQPGDTLWAIAERAHGGGDLAWYVDALVSLNGGSVIVEGQTIRLP